MRVDDVVGNICQALGAGRRGGSLAAPRGGRAWQTKRHCDYSPRHRMPVTSRNEVSKYASMTWRAMCVQVLDGGGLERQGGARG
jgi:hypothetical protein